MHRTLEKNVRAHLRAPGAIPSKGRLATLAADQLWSARITSGSGFTGASGFTPVGLPVIAARLVYPVLKIASPALLHEQSDGRAHGERG